MTTLSNARVPTTRTHACCNRFMRERSRAGIDGILYYSAGSRRQIPSHVCLTSSSASSAAGVPSHRMRPLPSTYTRSASRGREGIVLLHQQHGEPLGLQPSGDRRDLLHDDRREPLGGLVEEQQARREGEGARDGEHLLLAAGKLGAHVAAPLGEPREGFVHPVERPAVRDARQREVLLHRQRGEDAALLGHEGDTEPRDAMGREPRDVGAVETHAPGTGRHDPHDGLQRGWSCRRRCVRAGRPRPRARPPSRAPGARGSGRRKASTASSASRLGVPASAPGEAAGRGRGPPGSGVLVPGMVIACPGSGF